MTRENDEKEKSKFKAQNYKLKMKNILFANILIQDWKKRAAAMDRPYGN